MSPMLVVLLVVLVGGLVALLMPWPPDEAARVLGRWFAGLRRYAIRIGGEKWVYLAGGSGPVLLVIHGFGGDKDNFVPLAAKLTQHCRVISPDLPGFGESDMPEGGYDLDEQTARIARFVAALGIRKLHVAGNSMGGYIAGNLARLLPDVVESVWLLAPAGVETSEKTEFIRGAEVGDIRLIATTVAEYEAMFDWLFADRFRLPRFMIRGLGRQAVAKAVLWRKVFEGAFTNMVPLEYRVSELQCPTLVTWGDLDDVLHPSGADVLERTIRNVEVQRIRDAGHLPMTERPDECAEKWLSWRRS